MCSGEFRNAFVCVRPPGHHAGTDGLLTTASSCGFCVFNNVMIAALHALEKFPDVVKKIAIVDIGAWSRAADQQTSTTETAPSRSSRSTTVPSSSSSGPPTSISAF